MGCTNGKQTQQTHRLYRHGVEVQPATDANPATAKHVRSKPKPITVKDPAGTTFGTAPFLPGTMDETETGAGMTENQQLIQQETRLSVQLEEISRELVAMKMLIGRVSDEVKNSRQNLEQQMSQQFAGLTTILLTAAATAVPCSSSAPGRVDGREEGHDHSTAVKRTNSTQKIATKTRPRRMSLNANTTAGV
eukprot:SAG31_NODE_4106_length_3577_cov_3.156699_2_plen_192_part_00